MRLMCDLEINYAKMSKLLDLDFREHFVESLESLSDLATDGLVVKKPWGIEITDAGRLLIRVIAMRFDPYIQTQQSEGRYSKVI